MSVLYRYPANTVIEMMFNKSTRRNRQRTWKPGTPGQTERLSAEIRLERRHVSVLCIVIQLIHVIEMMFNKSTRRNRERTWRPGTPGQAERLSVEIRLERRHVSVLCINI